MASEDTKIIAVKFMSDTKDATRDMKAFKGSVSDATTKIGGTTGKGGLFGRIGMATHNMAQHLGVGASKFSALALKAGVATAALLLVKKGLGAVTDAGMEAEDAIVKLGVLFKDEAKAMATYQESLKFSIRTPFDPRDIVQGAVVAGQYGADAFQKGLYGMRNDAMTVIADMAAFSGQSMQEAATALFRGDLALLEKYGAQAREAYSEAKKFGEIGSRGFIQNFVKGMSEIPTWMGMAEKKSQTMSGIWSTIKGNAGLIWTYISGATEQKGVITFWTKLKNIVKEFSDGFGAFVADVKPILTDFGAVVGQVFGFIWSALKGVGAFVYPFIKFMIGGFKIILPIIKGIFSLVSQAFNGIFKIAGAVWGVLDKIFGVNSFLKSFERTIDYLVAKIGFIFTFLRAGFNSMIQSVKAFVEDNLTTLLFKIEYYLKAITTGYGKTGTTAENRAFERMKKAKSIMSGLGSFDLEERVKAVQNLRQDKSTMKIMREFGLEGVATRRAKDTEKTVKELSGKTIINYNDNSTKIRNTHINQKEDVTKEKFDFSGSVRKGLDTIIEQGFVPMN